MMMRRRALAARALAGLVLAAVAFLCCGAEAAKERVAITTDGKVTVDFDTDVTVFEGGVKITYSDVTITAERAEVKARKVATITGRPTLTQPDVTLKGDVFVAYISEKRVVVEGNVVLVKDEEKAGAPGEKERIEVSCDRIEVTTSTRGFTASGNVRVKRGGTEARADRASYTENDKLAVLEGNVSAQGKNGEKVQCERLLFRTDREYLQAADRVVLEFEVEEESAEGSAGESE